MKKDYLERQSYPTDLTDTRWAQIEPLFVGMREYKHSKRELTNAVLYLVNSGCKWRQLPHDFPPHFTVHSFYRRARLSGLWDKILEHLVRVTRQLTLTTNAVSTGEKNKRQKKANSNRYVGLSFGGSRSSSKFGRHNNGNMAGNGCFLCIPYDRAILRRQGLSWHFHLERTFAWLNNSRRLSKDYEICTNSAEAMIKLSHIHTLLKRL